MVPPAGLCCNAGLKALRHRAGSPACGVRLCEIKEDSPTFKKMVDIMFEFPAFTLNQTNINSQSEVVALINTRRKIVSGAAALMNGEEACVSIATR